MVFILWYSKSQSRPAIVPSKLSELENDQWRWGLYCVLLRVRFPGMLRQHRLTFRKNLYQHTIRSSISNFYPAPLVDTGWINKLVIPRGDLNLSLDSYAACNGCSQNKFSCMPTVPLFPAGADLTVLELCVCAGRPTDCVPDNDTGIACSYKTAARCRQ